MMAGLFDTQASVYSASRPTYPASLFSFLASLTSRHSLAWDVGTGSGQAAFVMADHYEKVVATDVSEQQLSFAPKRPHITYFCTPKSMSEEELHEIVGPEGSVDLVTVAQALHWFDLNPFYSQVKHVLRKPGGVFAAWCYTEPLINPAVDAIFSKYYQATLPHWQPARALVDDEYRSLHFPFEPVLTDGQGTGPIRFNATKQMTVEEFLSYLKSMSVLQTARKNGVELLSEDLQNEFRNAWGDDIRTVTYPVFLRVGTVLSSTMK